MKGNQLAQLICLMTISSWFWFNDFKTNHVYCTEDGFENNPHLDAVKKLAKTLSLFLFATRLKLKFH